MSSITFRKVTLADLDILLQISKQTFFDAFEALNNPNDFKAYTDVAFTVDKFHGELANPNSQFYFAVLNDEMVGYIKLNFADAQTEFQEAKAVEIERIYVLQAHQGKQIGLNMLNYALELAYRDKLNYIWLGVWEHNLNAIRFYQQYGFAKFSSHYFMLGNDKQTDILMKRPIV